MPLNSRAVDIAARAMKVLGVIAATTVKPAIPPRPTTIGILQLFTGEIPRPDRKSDSQPAPILPITPKANGMSAIHPVFGLLMCRSMYLEGTRLRALPIWLATGLKRAHPVKFSPQHEVTKGATWSGYDVRGL